MENISKNKEEAELWLKLVPVSNLSRQKKDFWWPLLPKRSHNKAIGLNWPPLGTRQVDSLSSWSVFLPILAAISVISHRAGGLMCTFSLSAQCSGQKQADLSSRSSKRDHPQTDREQSLCPQGKGQWGTWENTSSAATVPLKQFPFRSHVPESPQCLQSHTWAPEGETVSFWVLSSVLRKELSKGFLK